MMNRVKFPYFYEDSYITIIHEFVDKVGLSGAYLLSFFDHFYSDRIFNLPVTISLTSISKSCKIHLNDVFNDCKRIDDLNIGTFERVFPVKDFLDFIPNKNFFNYRNEVRRVMKPVKIFIKLMDQYGLKYAYFYGLLVNVAEVQWAFHPFTIIGEKPFMELTDKAKSYFKDFDLMKMLDFFRKKGLVDYIELACTKKLYFHLNFSNLFKMLSKKRRLNKLKQKILKGGAYVE